MKKQENTVISPKKQRKERSNVFRYSSTTAILISVFLVLLVAVNFLSTLIASKFSTAIDVTVDRSSKLTAENIDYLKRLNEQESIKEISIIVCATKASYTGSEMINYMANYYGVSENNTPYSYFNQTVRLLEEYPKYNSKITVEYHDPQEPDFSKLQSESSINITYGDILVRCFKTDGSTKSDVLTVNDIYEMQASYDSYGYSSSYTIVVSNLENALSGALNKVAMDITKTAAVLKNNCTPDTLSYLTSSLNSYDYQFTTYEGTVTYENLKGYDAILISGVTNDFDVNSLKEIDKFLNNEGKKGKSLIYFASQSSPETPNLNAFLEEWGISVGGGVLYETNSLNRGDNPTIFLQSLADNSYVSSLKNSNKNYWSGANSPLTVTYSTDGSKTTNILLSSSDTTLAAPKGSGAGYTPPANATTKSYPLIVLTTDIDTDADGNDIQSSVIVFAGNDFVSENYSQYSDIGNMDLATLAINTASGRSGGLYFTPKVTGTTGIATPSSAAVKMIVLIIFMFVIPLATLAGGIVIWILRIRK